MAAEPKDANVDQENGSTLNARLARKAELEAKLLEEQLAPAYRRREDLKAIAGASGIAIALATLLGGVLSILNWVSEQSRARELRIEERMDRALGQLSETRPTQRAAAVSSLHSLISGSNVERDSRVLVAVANALPLEDSSGVRNAMISMFEGIDPKVVRKSALNAALESLILNDRELVRVTKLWQKRPKILDDIEFGLEIKNGPNLQGIARAIAVLLHKGARSHDFSDTYLGRSDFSGLDLSAIKINLDDSILAGSDFSRSKLIGASFNGADLEQVRFVAADLRDAKFTFEEHYSGGRIRFSYIMQQIARSPETQIQVSMPSFACADLRGAVFSGHHLIPMAADTFDSPFKFLVAPADFRGANIAGADFRKVDVYGLFIKSPEEWPVQVTLFQGILGSDREDGRYLVGVHEIGTSSLLKGRDNAFSSSFHRLQDAFRFSNWSSALLPPALSEILSKGGAASANSEIRLDDGERCMPLAPW